MAGIWRTLYENMLEEMRDPAFRRFGSITVAGRTFSYRSLDDFLRLLNWVRQQADVEDGIAPYRARVALVNGGRGYQRRRP